MALDHVKTTNITGKTEPERQIFTFFIEDMMFGLDVENVLMLGQDIDEFSAYLLKNAGFVV
ncbi:MAG: hypothetical protein Q9N32_02430 [Gammaproteobacteria bacterium]|nr:hypothetical protein [Gammaproteobacteria bacterium]